jgi:hypothetical protein
VDAEPLRFHFDGRVCLLVDVRLLVALRTGTAVDTMSSVGEDGRDEARRSG